MTRLIGIGSASAILALGALAAEAGRNPGTDGFAVYEDWSTSDDIRGDRWRGAATSAQDTIKEQKGRHAHLRLRREGSNTSNTTVAIAELTLGAANPLEINRLEIDTVVKSLELVACPANPIASAGLPVQVSLNTFNDGTPRPAGDATGDHFGLVRLFRASASTDPPGALQVHLEILRCDNPNCSATHLIPGGFVALPTLVYVGDKVRLRLIWDDVNGRFVGGVNNDPDVPLAYPVGLNQGPSRVPFANISMVGSAVSCVGQAGVVDADVEIGVVRTNPEAVIQ
ncbi:MAG TPA: hypothetical protein VL086_08135 [Candidatus Nitrosotalea sp.]|nr:hypothetical protein [Candidatus Nitrosotalea sp.]